MGAIKILDPAVRDQIAAGEVVERPASVVKELVENSLDAGAKVVDVRVSGGGKTGIFVQDDGLGMDAEDLELACKRHATSKLTRLDDLNDSRLLGFRGEALAAISAVSRMTIVSRPRDAAIGYRLRLGAVNVPEKEPVSAPPGTQVAVEDLFYSVPARLKHLKTDAAELTHIQQLVLGLAFDYPDVAFRLKTVDRTIFEVSGRGNAQEVMLAAYGKDVASQSIPISYQSSDGAVTIDGILAPAQFGRSSRHAEFLIVNGRLIHNWTLRAAVEEAYRPQLRERRFPMFCLRMNMPGDRLDPNVHPQKAEVRIDGERQCAALLHRAVREALESHASSPSFWTPEVAFGDPPASTDASSQIGMSPVEPQSFFNAGIHHAREAGPEQAETVRLRDEIGTLEFMGQWRDKYIVAQGSRGLYLIDQHAAHERVYYEQFLRRFEEANPSQGLLVPMTVLLSTAAQEALETDRPALEAQGFDWTRLSPERVLVRAVPASLHDAALNEAELALILEGFVGARGMHSWSPVLDKAAMAACKAAIKAYRGLQSAEVTALFEQWAACDDPRSCPHGRPTLLHLTLEDVDRRFGRKG